MIDTGYFVFSLDTELAWGYFDKPRALARRFSADGGREREAAARLLDIFDEYGIASTWAVVGHLFFAECDQCDVCPVLEWRDCYPCWSDIYQTDHPLWYAADLIDMLQARAPRVEIGLHGYTHRVFTETALSSAEAYLEISEGVRAAQQHGIRPTAMIFPRNRVGHLGLLRDAGFICYRGAKVMPDWYRIPLFGKLLNRVNLVFQFIPPPTMTPYVDAHGLVNLPESAWFFRINRRIETALDALHLDKLRVNVLRRGVDHAARARQLMHIWAHPCEFRTDKDFDKLRYLLEHVARWVERGQLQSVTMSALADIVRAEAARHTPLQASEIMLTTREH